MFTQQQNTYEKVIVKGNETCGNLEKTNNGQIRESTLLCQSYIRFIKRSSHHVSDVGKMNGNPVIHVNGDRPEVS